MNCAAQYGPWTLITGASEGTGAAFARQLAAEGVALILIARRAEPLAALADEITAMGSNCITATVDLSAPDAAQTVINAVGNREVGLFIANAGADPNGARFLAAPLASWQALAVLNINTTIALAHHFAGPMQARGKGGLLLVGSGACYGGLPGIAVYSGVKAFLLGFAEGLWAELRHDGVHVLNLVLGRTDTPAHRRNLENAGQRVPDDLATPEDVARTGLLQLPHGPVHNFGQPNDVAGIAPTAPDARRARILAIEQAMGRYANTPEIS